MSNKYLQRYMDEFAVRYSIRPHNTLIQVIVANMVGRRLMYRQSHWIREVTEEEILIPPMDITPEELARRLFQLLPDSTENEEDSEEDSECEE